MVRFVILVFIINILTLSCYSQGINCGTKTPPNSAHLEQDFIHSGSLKSVNGISTCLNKVLSIRVVIVTDSSNVTGVAAADLTGAIDSLNALFSPICLSFTICDIDTVYNYNYNIWHQGDEEEAFRSLYAQLNVINLVLVETIVDPAGAEGYAPLGNGPSPAPYYDMIVMNKSGLIGRVLQHEMGHFFGLYHTFENSLGLEFVNGSNCTTSGDLLCDTPADIDPAPIAAGCVWTGTNTDPNGDYYTPILGNLMSYHNTDCAKSLTRDQYNRMIYSYLNFRNYLY